MKLSSFIAVAFALLLTACAQKPSPAQQAIDMAKEATQKVEQATDMAQLNSIQEEFQKKFEGIENPNDYNPTAEEEANLQTAMQEYLQAYIMKVNQLAESSIPMTSGDVDQVNTKATIDEGILEASEE